MNYERNNKLNDPPVVCAIYKKKKKEKAFGKLQ